MAGPVNGFTVEATCALEFGPGAVARVPALVDGLGGAAAFVVTDAGLRATGIVDRVVGDFTAAGLWTEVFDGIGPNPSTTAVEHGATALRAFGSCVVVAIGGGSVLDAAKGIALLATHHGARATDDLWSSPVAGLPLIAVPTTAGTGAETNGFGVVEDTCAKRKVYLGHASVRPRVAVLDPELTVGLPPAATAATGFDALVHGVESLASRGANPVSEAAAAQAVALVGRWLPVAVDDGTDLEARAQLLLGAHLAGQALTVSGLGLVHGIAHAVTAHTGTPHGVALASVNEQVMHWSADAAAEAYARAGAALGTADAVAGIAALVEGIRVRRPLHELGVDRGLLPVLAAAAVADPVTANAPRTPTEDDVREILDAAW